MNDTLYICNAFSPSMLDGARSLRFEPVSAGHAAALVAEWSGPVVSAVGHADTAAVVGGLLDYAVPANRVNVQLSEHDWLLVAQYAGPRMPEGSTTLPDGASIQFWVIRDDE